MQVPVLVEPVGEHGFRATGGEPIRVTAEGATPEQALANLKEAIENRLANGARLVPLELSGPAEHPWLPYAGTLKDDPLLEPWKEAMAEYRRQRDADPDPP